MQWIQSTLNFQFQKIRNNLLLSLVLVLLAAVVVYIGYIHHTNQQAIAYLVAMYACAFCTDLICLQKAYTGDSPIKKPAKETFYFILCFVLGMVFLIVRFSGLVSWDTLMPILKLLTLPLMLFVFPIGLAVILLLLKYKPKEMGFRWQGFFVVIPVLLIHIITNRLVCPQSLTWTAVLEESGGYIGLLWTGFIVSGLSEEYFRGIGQSRFVAFFKQAGWAWLITSILWAFMHAPKWYGETQDLTESVLSSIRIIPIGLMWGYVTYRTKSILPSAFLHGVNFWGLQNF